MSDVRRGSLTPEEAERRLAEVTKLLDSRSVQYEKQTIGASEPNWKVEALNGRLKIVELEARIAKSIAEHVRNEEGYCEKCCSPIRPRVRWPCLDVKILRGEE